MFTVAAPSDPGEPDKRKPGSPAYERHKRQAADLQRKKSASARDIAGDFPKVVNSRRRQKALDDFEYFCRIYFPEIFYLPFSPDHKRVIKKTQRVVEEGGLFAEAMPRGSGKTTICEAACLWAALKGLHFFIMLIGATANAATESLLKLRVQLETNDTLLEDFPEVCYPIRRLEGISQRRLLWNGERIRITITDTRLVLPSLPANPAASCCIMVAGLTGRIRGKKFTRPDGKDVRPSLVLVDDPSTDESAGSPKQNADREKLINGAVLGLAGPGRTIAALMPCTVIEPNDLADRILDRDKNPQWQGERLKFVYKFPESLDAEKHWQEYANIYRRCRKDGHSIREATKYYRKNRKAMDDGAELAWPQRFNQDEISALQHAWNIRINRGDAAFFSEYQNEPLRPQVVANILPSADKIAARFDHRKEGMVPQWASHLTAFVDVHDELLYWAVCGFSDSFKGAVIQYGTWPEQTTEYFSLATAKQTLSLKYPTAGLEAKFTAALNALYDELLKRDWPRENSPPLKLSRAMTDANYGNSRDTVYEVIRRRNAGMLLLPSHGYGIGPAKQPISEWKGKDGDRRGENWQITTGGRGQIHVNFDSNAWKSFLFQRLIVPAGDPGSFVLYGDNAYRHRLLSDHLTAETFDRVTSQNTGRTVDMFSLKQSRPDNHWLDCMVGCFVAASIDGCSLEIPGLQKIVPPKRFGGMKFTF